ncbi:MAG: RHS repeat-associated core domain-containing protein [Planctomycetota bacterium]
MRQIGQTDGNGVAAKRAKFEYDDSNRLTNLYRYQNSTESDLVAKAAYGRDTSGRLTSLTYTDATTIDLAKYQWTYDAADRISQMKTSRDAATGDWGVADYIYDARGQLTDTQYTNYAGTMPTEDYNYDGNGNRANTGYATGDDNRMTSSPNPGSGTYTYSYDDQGNRTARWIAVNDNKVFDGTDSDGLVYAWDAGGRLTSVTYYAIAEGSADWKVSYYYDLQNRLVGRDLDPDANEVTDNTQRKRFVYDGDQVVLEFDKTGSGDITNANLSHRYLWGVAVDQLLADENLGTLRVDWTLGDHINSVRDVATYGSGTTTLVDHRAYDAFGNVKIHAGAVDLLFQFTGRMHDEKTGLQNNLNRWYDASVGKWLSEDPLGFGAGDANLYRYCGNGPTNGVDPSGMAKMVETGVKGIKFFIEWWPEKGTGEIKILTKAGGELAIAKYIKSKGIVSIVKRHGGDILPGVARSVLKKISDHFATQMDRVVERVGGEWGATQLTNAGTSGLRKGLARAGGAVAKGCGEALGVVLIFFELENTAGAAEYHPTATMTIPVDPRELGLSDEDLESLSVAAEEEDREAKRLRREEYFATGNFGGGSAAELDELDAEKARIKARQERCSEIERILRYGQNQAGK